MTLLVTRTEDMVACRELRRAVFIDEQGVSEADEWDGRDGDAIHLLALLDGQPIGTLRLFPERPEAKIGRVCVLASVRGTGAGATLCRAALDILTATEGVRTVRLGAQLQVLDFYRRLGFEAEGPVYDDAGIAHRDMTRAL